jgi:hypothetical protein
MTSRISTLLIATATLAAACSTDDEIRQIDLEEASPSPVEQRAGSVLVEYNPTTSNGVSVHAQFMDVRGVSVETAFDALDVWTPDGALDRDACSVRVPPSAGEESEDVRLRMLDVGPIAVSALEHSIRLEGRRVPDLRTFSGVVYGNEEGFDFDQAFLPFEPEARYAIAAPGGEEAGGFHVTLQAPSVPEIETVSGRYAVDTAPIRLDGDDLELRWTVNDPGAALYLDIGPASFRADGPRLRCRLDDDGDFVVPYSILDRISASGTPLSVTLRRADVIKTGIDEVEDTTFVFAATDQVVVTPR